MSLPEIQFSVTPPWRGPPHPGDSRGHLDTPTHCFPVASSPYLLHNLTCSRPATAPREWVFSLNSLKAPSFFCLGLRPLMSALFAFSRSINLSGNPPVHYPISCLSTSLFPKGYLTHRAGRWCRSIPALAPPSLSAPPGCKSSSVESLEKEER